MRRLRYVLLVGLAAVVVAVIVVVAVLGRGGETVTSSRPSAQVLSASATLSPQSLLFGEPVHVRVEAVVDRRELDPKRMRLNAHWVPFEPVTRPVRTETDVGPYARLLWTVDIHCVTTACVPKPGMFVRQTLPVGTISYDGRAENGRSVAPVRMTWPEVTTVSRLDPADLQPAVIIHRSGTHQQQASFLPWRLNSAPLGDPTYRFAPNALFWAAAAVALLLVAAAGLILSPYLPSVHRLWRRPQPPSQLERALATLEAARGAGADERKALALLAAELGRSGSGSLAWTATELAWSRTEPAAERTAALAEEVRRELAERTNGHHG